MGIRLRVKNFQKTTTFLKFYLSKGIFEGQYHCSMMRLSFFAFWAPSLISMSSSLEEVDVNESVHLSG